MAAFPPSGKTVRVASLSRTRILPEPSDAVWVHVREGRGAPAELEQVRVSLNAIDNDLMVRAEREAQAGAKIIFWAEGNAPVLNEDESALMDQARQLATKYRIYLGMALATWTFTENRPLQNKMVLIDPNGQVAWKYIKARPVPGGEAAMSVRSDGRLRYADTPYGRLSAVICFDADFPHLVMQAGALGADIVLDPSGDWRAIDPWHTQMASFRAIEQGFNLVRQTSGGLSAAYDYQGRLLSVMDHYETADHVMVSQIPVKGVRTVYSRFGDWFAWLCAATLIGLFTEAVTRGEGRPETNF